MKRLFLTVFCLVSMTISVRVFAQNTDDKPDHEAMTAVMERVEQAIRDNQYHDVRQFFTNEGYSDFMELCHSGHAVIIGKPEYEFIDLNELTLCRSILMELKYSDDRVLLKNLVFRFTNDNKIESIAYMLSSVDEQAILCVTTVNPVLLLTMLTFLEDYQTAYSLRRLDFLDYVFSADALVIRDRKIQAMPGKLFSDSKPIHYYTKSKHLKQLSRLFARKGYIGLNLTDFEFRAQDGKQDMFSIQARQECISEHYGDMCYFLFLFDLSGENPGIPVHIFRDERSQIDKFSMQLKVD